MTGVYRMTSTSVLDVTKLGRELIPWTRCSSLYVDDLHARAWWHSLCHAGLHGKPQLIPCYVHSFPDKCYEKNAIASWLDSEILISDADPALGSNTYCMPCHGYLLHALSWTLCYVHKDQFARPYWGFLPLPDQASAVYIRLWPPPERQARRDSLGLWPEEIIIFTLLLVCHLRLVGGRILTILYGAWFANEKRRP